MKKPHKHADLIKAWADGAEIQVCYYGNWEDAVQPYWDYDAKYYRIKPEPKPDIKWFSVAKWQKEYNQPSLFTNGNFNLLITFDGETGELKSAEVLK